MKENIVESGTKEERYQLADQIMQGIYYISDEAAGEWNSLRDYIAGVTEEQPGNLSGLYAYDTNFYANASRGISQRWDAACQENPAWKDMMLRMIRILHEKNQGVLQQYFHCFSNQYYSLLKEAGVSKKFLESNVEFLLDAFGREPFSAFSGYAKQLVHDLSTYFPEWTEQWIKGYQDSEKQKKEEKNQNHVAAILVAGRGFTDFVEKRALPDLERIAWKQETKRGHSMLNVPVGYSIQTGKEDMIFLFQYLTLCCGLSEEVDRQAASILLRCPEWMYEFIKDGDGHFFCSLCDAFHTGPEPKLYYLLYCFRSEQETWWPHLLSAVQNIHMEEGHALESAFERLCDQKDMRAVTAFALYRKIVYKKAEMDESAKKQLAEHTIQVEQLILHLLKRIQAEAPAREPLFLWEGNIDLTSALWEYHTEEPKISINPEYIGQLLYNPDRYPWYGLVQACCPIMDALPIAKNLVLLTVNQLDNDAILPLKLYENSKHMSLHEGNPFEKLYAEGVPFVKLCEMGVAMASNVWKQKSLLDHEGFRSDWKEFLFAHKEETEKEVQHTHLDSERYIVLLQELYDTKSSYDLNALAFAFHSKSKQVLRFAENRLREAEGEVRTTVERIAASSSKGAAAVAQRLLHDWNNQRMESRMKELKDTDSLREYVEKQYTNTNEQNVPYVKHIDYGCVHWKDSESLMPEIVMKYYISEYILLDELYRIPCCEEIRSWVNPQDLRTLMVTAYEHWLDQGAGTKFKNILFPFALEAGSAQLEILKHQIDEWSQNSKPSLAAFAVSCLAQNGSQMAFMMVDTMSKKHKNKKVKKAAAEALETAMGIYGFSKEEFEDLIVPDLGFQKDRTRRFSYGGREFRAVLKPDLSILLYYGEKQLRSLPKPSEKYGDNEQLALAAKEEYKALKKQRKEVIEAQKLRIRDAVYSRRSWDREKWEALFLGNPLMFSFACGMIWEERNPEGGLWGRFRFMEDGTFNTAEEEEYELHGGSRIFLSHPADMEIEEREAWIGQLADYEIEQPVPQMDLPVPELSKEERVAAAYCRYSGKQFYAASVRSVAGKMGAELYFIDYGDCNGCERTFEHPKCRVKILVTPFYPGDYQTVLEIQEIVFEDGEGKRLLLGEVPKGVLSYACQIGKMLTSKSVQERKGE